MVGFCGWSMPLEFPSAGVRQSVLHTRSACSIFDVSHMMQLRFSGGKQAEFLERLVPSEVRTLKDGEMVYSHLTNRAGGIVDDCIISRYSAEEFVVVVNAGCADKDLQHILREKKGLGYDGSVSVEVIPESLISVNGPQSARVLQRHLPSLDLATVKFMNARHVTGTLAGFRGCRITRCGYTGEDGFEVSIPAQHAVAVTKALYAEPEVLPAGLGARDVLRLEAMLPLYGNDIDETTSPVEANLSWVVAPSRRVEGPDVVPFLGDKVIRDQLNNSTFTRRRVGFFVEGGIARQHCKILDPATGQEIGEITSGTFSPFLKRAVAMGYVQKAFAKKGISVKIDVRGKTIDGTVHGAKSFVPTTYFT
ncbi:MAG: glycine cleavage system aminomethyltransferase GcvT [archaeon]|nr:glycine cleavage system aminomethyltransferase GcvT [archaeon]